MAAPLFYPGDPQDSKGLIQFKERVVQLHRPYRQHMERDAYRNVLFYLGHQWIVYDDPLGVWRPMGLKKGTPRPVTNKIAPKVNTFASNLVSYRVPITYGPGSNSPEDIAAALVAEKINSVIEKETNIRLLKPLIARWIALTGNAFIISQYDNSEDTGIVKVPYYQCTQCGWQTDPKTLDEGGGACQECENTEFVPAMSEKGEPITESYPRGKHYTEVESLFSTYMDPTVQYFSESPYVMVTKIRPKSWFEAKYPEMVDKIQWDAKSDPYTTYLESLALTTGSSSRYGTLATTDDEPKAKVHRIWLRPYAGNPNGCYAVVAGNEVLESDELKYHDETGKVMVPVVHCGFDLVPGRTLYKTRVDDLIAKQEQRNRIESMIEMHLTRMAGAKWLIPTGSGLSKVTGDQGLVLQYTPVPGGDKPTRISGDTIPQYFLQWISLIDADMDDIMGQYEVGRGEAPKGVSAYAALQLLDERAQQGQSNVMDNWSNAWMEWSKQNLNIWREYADEERNYSLGEGTWAIEKFSKASLQGGVDLDVELGQNRPRTQVGRRAVIEQAVRLAVVNPLDPQERFRVLSVLGVPELMEDFKADKERANRENDIWANGGIAPMPLPWDNHMIHLAEHRRFIISEKFESLPDLGEGEVDPATGQQRRPQDDCLLHAKFHYDSMQMMAGAQGGKGMPGQMAPHGGPPGPGGGSKGTARGDQAGTEAEMVQQDAQMASPDIGGGISI